GRRYPRLRGLYPGGYREFFPIHLGARSPGHECAGGGTSDASREISSGRRNPVLTVGGMEQRRRCVRIRRKVSVEIGCNEALVAVDGLARRRATRALGMR